MMYPSCGPADEVQTLTPARAEACRRTAQSLGFVHACLICDAALLPGAVVGYYTAEGLREHQRKAHGEALP